MNPICLIKRIKGFVDYAFNRPYGAVYGDRSIVMRPRVLLNREKINIGSRLVMRGNGVIYPIISYGDEKFEPEVIIGNDVYIGVFCQIHCLTKVVIGDGVVFSDHVYVSDVAHGMDPDKGLIMKQPIYSKGGVVIGSGSFVGFGASIMPGVHLGAHCIVGARSVVTRSFPDYSMVAGAPAKLIKRYCTERKVWISDS